MGATERNRAKAVDDKVPIRTQMSFRTLVEMRPLTTNMQPTSMPGDFHRRLGQERPPLDRKRLERSRPGASGPRSHLEDSAKQGHPAQEIPEWRLSKDGAIKALPSLRQAAKSLRSGNALVETPQTRKAQGNLAQLYKLYPDLRVPKHV
jgi:hypothetical protein